MLTAIVHAFEAAHENGELPRVEDFVPTGAAEHTAIAAALVRVDLAYRRKRGLPIRLDDYLAPFPELDQQEDVLFEIIEAELQDRQQQGEDPTLEAYGQRFPAVQARLDSQLTSLAEGDLAPVPAPLPPSRLKSGGLPELPGYQVLSLLGQGGMGVVYRVKDDAFHRSLAVKVLRDEHRFNANLKGRFLEEAQLMGQLQHPGIPPVHDLGQLPDGRPYFAMKLIKGRTLAQLLRERSDPSQGLPPMLAICEQVCRTLAYTHAQGVIHRDLKPANIMVGAFGEVQVMDWGLAKVLTPERRSAAPEEDVEPTSTICTVRTEEPEAATLAGMAMGTPAYMAPEQARGEVDQLDARCDVFGLGAILCEVLTGKPPFDGQTTREVLERTQLGQTAPALARLEQTPVDRELVALTGRCLAAHKEDRPTNGGEVLSALTAYLAGVQERLRQAEIQRARAEGKAGAERKRRRQVVVLALVGVVLLLLAGLAYVRSERSQAELQTQAQIAFNDWRSQATSLHDLARATWDKVRTVPFPDLDQRREADRRWQDLAKVVEAGETWLSHEDPELQRQAQELIPALRAEVARARADLRLLHRLEEARNLRGDISDKDHGLANPNAMIVFGHGAIRAYAAAFGDAGLDVIHGDPARLGQNIAGRAIKVPLAAALDDWLALEYDSKVARRLYQIAHTADPSTVRDPLRRAMVERDAAQLKRLAWKALVPRDLPTPTAIRLVNGLHLVGDLALAVAIRKALTHPDLPTPTAILLADGLHLVGDLELAVQVLEEAHRQHPGDFWTNDILGVFLLHTDPPQAAEANRHFSMALACRPESPFVYYNLGQTYILRNRWAEATRALQKALALRPSLLAAKVTLSSVQARQGKLDQAIKNCREVLAVEPENFFAEATLASHLLAKGNLVQAEATARAAIRHKPKHRFPRFVLAQVLAEKKELDQAIAMLQELAVQHPRHAEIFQFEAHLWSRKNDLDKALAACRKALALQPRNGGFYTDLCALHVLRKDYDRADQAARKAFALRPEGWQDFFDLGNSRLGQQDIDGAVFALAWAVHGNPTYAEGHFALADAYTRQNDQDRAIRHWKAVIDLEPRRAEAFSRLAGSYNRKAKFAAAAASAKRALALDPQNTTAFVELSWARFSQGDAEKALEHLRQALAINPKLTVAYRNRGWICFQQGAYDKAIDAYEKARALDARDATVYDTLSLCYVETGRLTKAREVLHMGLLKVEGTPGVKNLQASLHRLEPLLRFEPQLPAIVRGDLKPRGPEESLAFGRLCRACGYGTAAVRLYEGALGADGKPAANASIGDLLLFARAALRAAAGEGHEPPPEQERPQYRARALRWLRSFVKINQQALQTDFAGFQLGVQQNLFGLLNHQELATVRPPALNRLPANEQQEWQAFWDEVRQLRHQAEAPFRNAPVPAAPQ